MNVPKLRFKEFNDEWTKIDLSTCFEYFSTNSLSREQLSDHGIIKNIHYGDIHKKYGNVVDVENDVATYIKDTDQINKYEFCCENDIIFADASEDYDGIGKAIELINVNEKLVSGLHTIHARDKKQFFSPLFKGYYFNTPIIHNQIRILANGFKVFGISKDNINNLKVMLPSKQEQEKIAKLLSLLDKKIQLQTKKIEALKLFKLSITQNIFNEKKLNDFQSVTLEKILKPGSKIPVKNTSEYEKMTVKLNFKGLAKLETKKEMADTRPFYVRNENEIIIGKQNYFNGSIAKVTKDFKGCICSNAIMSFTTINGVNVDYVLYYLSQKNYINRRKFLANGTGQKELSEKEFLKFVIKLPSTQIQNNISKKISCVSNLLLLENKKLTTLNNLKKGLLQNLFI